MIFTSGISFRIFYTSYNESIVIRLCKGGIIMSDRTKVAIVFGVYSACLYGMGFIIGHNIGCNRNNCFSQYLKGYSLGYEFGSKEKKKEDK